MGHLACVNVFALPLQLLGRRHPDWLEGPMAVVDRDEPEGRIEWVNRAARKRNIRPGMRYGSALSLSRTLRAGTVESRELEEALVEILQSLESFSPVREPVLFTREGEGGGRRASGDPPPIEQRAAPGAVWLDAGGLEGVFESMEAWATAIVEELLERDDLYATVVVGWSRFGTYAMAREHRGVRIFESYEAERRAARRVSLARLGLPDSAREMFERLNVSTVGDLLALPPEGVRRRFSDPVWRWYRRARGDLERPVESVGGQGPVDLEIEFDEPLTVETRLVFAVKRRLNPVLGGLERGPRGVRALELAMIGPTGDVREMRVAPATPTARAPRLMELFRLKLESDQRQESVLPERGIARVEIDVEIVRDEPNQIQLFGDGPSRDLGKANRALARLRAEFGESSVVRGRSAPGHLPEARARWEPFDEIEEISSVESGSDDEAIGGVLSRRMWQRPKPVQLPGAGPCEQTLPDGRSAVLAGPYFIDGAWWATEIRRAYHYAERPDGQLWWVYYDLERGEWCVQGRVE